MRKPRSQGKRPAAPKPPKATRLDARRRHVVVDAMKARRQAARLPRYERAAAWECVGGAESVDEDEYPHCGHGAARAVELDRRRLLIGGGALLSTGSPACPDAKPFRFGLTPVFLTSDLALLEGLQRYLSQAMDREVRLVLRRTYQEITAELVSGQREAAWICGYPFVAYRQQLSLVAVPVWRGGSVYQAYLIAADGRAAAGIDDLAGDVHAFSDPDSNSGFLVTRALLAERNLRPESFFSRAFFTYGHRNVVRAVASGLARSGSVDGYVWDVLNEVEPELTSRTQVIWRSVWMGFPPIATSTAYAASPDTARFGQSLRAMAHDAVGRQVLRTLRLDGFAAAEPSMFENISDRMNAVRNAG
jgi:phosphonate transport system substrate-binding protein